MRGLWRSFLRFFGLLRGAGRGNVTVQQWFHSFQSGWVKDVTGVVVWIQPLDEREQQERKRRRWRHFWRRLREWFGAPVDHTDRYPHQIFLIEVEQSQGLTIRVENNLYSGRELKGMQKGMRVEVGGEYLPNDKGGKIHHTHGQRGYVHKR